MQLATQFRKIDYALRILLNRLFFFITESDGGGWKICGLLIHSQCKYSTDIRGRLLLLLYGKKALVPVSQLIFILFEQCKVQDV